MTAVLLKDLKGKQVGEITLNDSVFAIQANTHLMHAALVRQLANARSGSANTKTRAEVRGGGAKPWRQKGTGRARAGSIRSPLWVGGGVIFGPKPRDYSIKMPKKARALALRSALSARREDFVVIQNFDALFKTAPKAGQEVAEQPKTKQFVQVLKDLGLTDKVVLVVLSRTAGAQQIARSARNIPSVKVVDVTNLNVKDLIYCQAVLTTECVIKILNERFNKSSCGSATNTCASASESVDKTAKEEAPVKAAKTKAASVAKKSAEPQEAEAAPAKKATRTTKKAADVASSSETPEKKAPARKKAADKE